MHEHAVRESAVALIKTLVILGRELQFSYIERSLSVTSSECTSPIPMIFVSFQSSLHIANRSFGSYKSCTTLLYLL